MSGLFFLHFTAVRIAAKQLLCFQRSGDSVCGCTGKNMEEFLGNMTLLKLNLYFILKCFEAKEILGEKSNWKRIANDPEFCHSGANTNFSGDQETTADKSEGRLQIFFLRFCCSSVNIWRVYVGLKFCNKSGPYSTGNKMISNMFGRSLK